MLPVPDRTVFNVIMTGKPSLHRLEVAQSNTSQNRGEGPPVPTKRFPSESKMVSAN